MKTICTADQIARQLESLARRIAPTIALVITALIVTYNAGYATGRVIHQANDWLAQRWPTCPTSTAEPLVPVIAATETVVLVDDVVALRAQGLTQRAIAERLGVSRTTVRRRLAASGHS